ncbi:transcriptional regulator [Arthrobacter sp. AQ5-05]|uniref:helix-turn-helix transcriptional regulator n=1 Tax=Arthrobacter sp. AQ5-05 TaxID=2184581 RepID=UPI000DCEF077|nr:winged helix-turn-helix domain-containing protein [Arthrobacter sp. AQ5-05]RAX49099.1 transcriptional regulator [Arthrobacter sp. AQ5-05]
MTTKTPATETTPYPISPPPRPAWTFLTNHSHVLLAVNANPRVLVNEIAATVGITPRATLHILADLEKAGYLERLREGRRTRYVIQPRQHFRHPATAHQGVDAFLTLFAPTEEHRRKESS